MYGLAPTKIPTNTQRQKAQEINSLFDDMKDKYGLTSLEVFRTAAEGLHSTFLHNVCACPKFVVDYCQRCLAPDTLARRALKQKEELRELIRRRKKELEELEKAA